MILAIVRLSSRRSLGERRSCSHAKTQRAQRRTGLNSKGLSWRAWRETFPCSHAKPQRRVGPRKPWRLSDRSTELTTKSWRETELFSRKDAKGAKELPISKGLVQESSEVRLGRSGSSVPKGVRYLSSQVSDSGLWACSCQCKLPQARHQLPVALRLGQGDELFQ